MITSTANQKVRYVRSLHRRSVRHREKRFIVEGMRLIEEMNEAGQEPAFVFHTEAFSARRRGGAVIEALRGSAGEVLEVSDEVMRAVADTKTPQGILAVVRFSQPVSSPSSLVLVLDGVRDPGNLGTILRSAQAAGVGKVITMKGTVDAFSPKVVRGAMGAHFRLSVLHDRQWHDIHEEMEGRQILLADCRGGLGYHEVDWLPPTVLIVGGEARGAGREARELASLRVTIPMEAEVDSLNVAVATSIILFEAARQKRAGL